jgi:hypothetical protein
VKGKRGRKRRKLLDELKEKGGTPTEGRVFRQQDVDSTLWKRLGPVVRRTTK